jgi:hypothetical protein
VRQDKILRHWLVEGFVNETVEEESHDQHPGREKADKILPPQQIQQE